MLRLCISIFFMFFIYISPVLAQTRLGSIIEVEGNVSINGKKAVVDEPLFLGDIVATDAGAKAFIFLIDNTEFTLSENAKFEVTQYNYDEDNSANNKARYSVIEGAFRYVSGLVAKRENPDVEISTEFGAIGIRGTDFTVARETSGGYDVYVDEGMVNVKNERGASLLKRGEGTSVRSRRHAPTKAKKWHQKRINKMHENVRLKRQAHIRKKIEKQRKHRKEKLKQRHEQRKGKLQELKKNHKGKWKDKINDRKGNLQNRKKVEKHIKRLKNNKQFKGGKKLKVIRPKRINAR